MTDSFNDLKSPIPVPLDRIFIDPNNPRIAEDRTSRYDNPDEIFDTALQDHLTKRTFDVYQAKDLHDAIVAQGWVPIDAILVWEHPDRPEHYIVVEGNTRTSVLRTIRQSTLQREQTKLERMQKSPTIAQPDVHRQDQIVSNIKQIISDTDNLMVFPVNAANIDELEEVLPRLLGVRHISHSRSWGPFAENMYMTALYVRQFRERHGPDHSLHLEQDLIDQVAAKISLGSTKTRRNIQAASAFQRFKINYEDQLPQGESFSNSDQYFFENILQNKHAYTEFDFTRDRLHMPDESERALFLWAFSKPRRGSDDENENVFYKAENIRLWSSMAKYDSSRGTAFASQFDVSYPEKATKTMRLVEAEFLHHKAQSTPLDTLESLRQVLRDLKGETMITQAEFLMPALEDISEMSTHYLTMMKADAAT